MLGYPDRAVVIADECFAHARLIGHPFNYGFALMCSSTAFFLRGERDKYYACNDAAQKLGRETGIPFFSEVWFPMIVGVFLAQEGRLSEGIERMRTSLDRFDAVGFRIGGPYYRSLLGEALALAGDVDSALTSINLALDQIARPGWEERFHHAESLRLKGWLLSLKDDHEGAEQNYLASLDWARRQQAKSWELRTATSLARLWCKEGKRAEALNLLKPVHEWFTEGFETKDLKEAKAQLDELA